MSKANITKFYRKALILGGMSIGESKKYSFHGARRAHVTFAKNYGQASDGTVALGTKHAQAGNVPHYNDASRAQLSKPALFQGELRDKMRAVIAMKEIPEEKRFEVVSPSTPEKIPGEVIVPNATVSPTEVHLVDSFLSSRGIGTTELREAESIKPGVSKTIMDLAAQLALGKKVRKPRFGLLGSVVRKLQLFDDNQSPVSKKRIKIHNSYNAPVQVFNGPVFFGGSQQAFHQIMMNNSFGQSENSAIDQS